MDTDAHTQLWVASCFPPQSSVTIVPSTGVCAIAVQFRCDDSVAGKEWAFVNLTTPIARGISFNFFFGFGQPANAHCLFFGRV